MSDFYEFTKIDEHSYRISSLEKVFCELIVGNEKALLIDTGYGFGNLKKTVEGITNKPLIVVNTHGHVDHTCGNYQFDGPVYIGKEDMDLCRRHNGKEVRNSVANSAKNTFDYKTERMVYGLPEDFSLENYISKNEGKLAVLEDGTIFDLGGVTIQVISTPGHTKGSMSFYYKEENRLYAGDEVSCFCWLFDDDAADINTHIETLEGIKKLAPKEIYSGHNPMPVSLEELELYIKAAREADYENAMPFENDIIKAEKGVRVSFLPGQRMKDIGKPGFAAIVIDKSRSRK